MENRSSSQKAIELVKKFAPLVYRYSGSGMLTNEVDKGVELDFAKRCATIAVEQMIDVLELQNTKDSERIKYWKYVKNEICLVNQNEIN